MFSVAVGGDLGYQELDFLYGEHQGHCIKSVQFINYKVSWDSLCEEHHINMSIFTSRGLSQIVDISAKMYFSSQHDIFSSVDLIFFAIFSSLSCNMEGTCWLILFPFLKFLTLICLCSVRVQHLPLYSQAILLKEGNIYLGSIWDSVFHPQGFWCLRRKTSRYHGRGGEKVAVTLWHVKKHCRNKRLLLSQGSLEVLQDMTNTYMYSHIFQGSI